MFSPFRGLRPRLPQGVRYSARERAIRSLLMALFIGLAAWGFWQNSGRYVQKFNAESRIADDSGLLESKQKERIGEALGRLDEKYGVKVYIKISLLPLSLQAAEKDAPANAIFFGLCPSGRQFVMLMPDDWRTAIGADFLLRLRDETMRPALAGNAWPEALLSVLEKLETRLAALAAQQKKS